MIGAAIALVVSLGLFVYSIYTIYGYSKTGAQKDTKYYLFAFLAFASLIGMVGAGFMMSKGSARSGPPSAVSAAIAGKGELLDRVDVEKLIATAQPANVDALIGTIERTAAQVTAKVAEEASMKKRVLEPVLEGVQKRIEAQAAQGVGAKMATTPIPLGAGGPMGAFNK
jgi:hypothetical protein